MSDLFGGECLPPGIDPEMWRDYLDERAESRHPMSERAQKRALQKLVRLQVEGHDPNLVLEASIASGYRGLFAGRDTYKPESGVSRNGKRSNARVAEDVENLYREERSGRQPLGADGGALWRDVH